MCQIPLSFRFCVLPISLILCFLGVFSSQVSANSLALLPGTIYKSDLGAVATVHPDATRAAAKQLQNGGSAIDAAIAAALTLGVVDSYNSGVGGGLFALVHWADGRVEAIDAREKAPINAYRDMFLRRGVAVPDLSRHGALAIGVPGSVAAFEYLSKAGGVKPLKGIYEEAAALAESGFLLSPSYVRRLARTAATLKQFPEAAAIFLNKGEPWSVGHRLIQQDLAGTYRKIAQQGAKYFYQGEFSRLVEQWMEANNGIIGREDFAAYQLRLRQPVKSDFLGYQVYGFPPPSSGGVHVAEILNMLELSSVQDLSQDQQQHVLVESMKLAFADRAFWLGDPDFAAVPKGLIDRQYAQSLIKRIDLHKASTVAGHSTPLKASQELFEKHTTHISVADKQGNWVSITTTLNTSFGSKVVIPGTGVLMNNQMDDFSAQPGVPNAYGLVGSEANDIQPGKRPLSSMSPTIVAKEGVPVLSVGAAGGPMIISQVARVLMRYLAFDDSLYEALANPRIHQQWKPDIVFVDRLLPSVEREALVEKGHVLQQLRFEGSTNAVSKRGGQFDAVSEPRLFERDRVRGD